jgi:hypothetical protein
MIVVIDVDVVVVVDVIVDVHVDGFAFCGYAA